MSFQEVKICLLGESGVGKSSIAQRFVHNTFFSQTENTIGASFMMKTFILNNVTYKLNIWDTAGQERYRALTPMYYRGSAACIIVYDVTSMESFQKVQNWLRELRFHISNISTEVVIALAGNKCDLKDKRKVLTKDGKAFADSMGAIFMETSAKNANNINDLFFQIVSKIPKNESQPKPNETVNISQASTTNSSKSGCC